MDMYMYVFLNKYGITSNLRPSFFHIFSNWKLGRVLYSENYFSLFESLENNIFLEKQVAVLEE
jgi:hypothetical protein